MLTEIGLDSRNTLDHHPQWLVGKALLARPPVGFGEARIYRNLLARNRLNLEMFHGFQEVLFNSVFRLDAARFRYRLAENAYLIVILHKTADGFRGVRLSRNPVFPTIWFRADKSGGFLEQRPLDLPQGPGWRSCEVTPQSVDGVELPTAENDPGVFGFRGSLARVEVDDVAIWGDGKLLWRENFRNERHVGAVLLECVALVLVLSGLVYLRGRHLHWVLLANLLSLFVLLVYLLCDYTVWSSAYLSYYRLEQLRMRVAQRLFAGVDPLPERPDTRAITEFLRVPKPASTSSYRLTVYRNGHCEEIPDTLAAVQALPRRGRRILFLGSSQTWGEGAGYLDEGMIGQLSPLLPHDELVNASQRGSLAGQLLTRYQLHLYALAPDLIVANLANNDIDERQLAEDLTRLAQLGHPLVLVLEANSQEAEDRDLAAKHAAMRAVAHKQGLACLDLHAALKAREKTGLLWWDKVHPTSYGHRLAAEFLARGLQTLVEKRP